MLRLDYPHRLFLSQYTSARERPRKQKSGFVCFYGFKTKQTWHWFSFHYGPSETKFSLYVWLFCVKTSDPDTEGELQ